MIINSQTLNIAKSLILVFAVTGCSKFRQSKNDDAPSNGNGDSSLKDESPLTETPKVTLATLFKSLKPNSTSGVPTFSVEGKMLAQQDGQPDISDKAMLAITLRDDADAKNWPSRLFTVSIAPKGALEGQYTVTTLSTPAGLDKGRVSVVCFDSMRQSNASISVGTVSDTVLIVDAPAVSQSDGQAIKNCDETKIAYADAYAIELSGSGHLRITKNYYGVQQAGTDLPDSTLIAEFDVPPAQ